MRKKTAPARRSPCTQPTAGDLARQRRADIAYRAYVLKALRRFDLESRFESTRRPRERMLSFLCLEPEQAYQTELAVALGEHGPKKISEN
jgi:hypothetical protein